MGRSADRGYLASVRWRKHALMPRHPEWFERLPAIAEALAHSAEEGPTDGEGPGELGRPEIAALFGLADRDAIRLLNRFGAQLGPHGLVLPRPAVEAQLAAIRAGAAYQAFLRTRQGLAQQLADARQRSAARKFRARAAPFPSQPAASLGGLPPTVRWRREPGETLGRFEIRYEAAEDLLWQLAEFLEAAAHDRAAFFAGTEPESDEAPGR